MEAAAFALIVVVGLVGFGLIALTVLLRRTPHNAFPGAKIQGHWLLDNGFERDLPEAPAQLSGSDLDRRVAFKLKRIPAAERAQFVASWLELERRFAEDPPGTARAAHALSLEVMRARGYPVSDQPAFEPNADAGESRAELEQTMKRYRNLIEAMIELPARRTYA